jgi:hypothetical protein
MRIALILLILALSLTALWGLATVMAALTGS